jgi:hypothetical protein
MIREIDRISSKFGQAFEVHCNMRMCSSRGTKTSPLTNLIHQKGLKVNGWNGNSEFFWPILVAPKNTKTAIFGAELQ